MNKRTVFIIDDDPSVREAIETIVKSVGLRAKTFASTSEFLLADLSLGPNCLVLDVRLPQVSGLDFQQELRHANIAVPIIFITGYADVPMTVRAMKGGAVEFLTKPFRDQDLLDAITVALERDQARREVGAQNAELRTRFETLTPRERQVMRLMVAGRLTREIAEELGTSEITAKVHRAHVLQKMQAKSLVDLVKFASRLGANVSGDYT